MTDIWHVTDLMQILFIFKFSNFISKTDIPVKFVNFFFLMQSVFKNDYKIFTQS